MSFISVVIAHHDVLARMSIAHILAFDDQLVVRAEAPSATAATRAVAATRIDVALVDANLDGPRRGIAAAMAVRRVSPSTKIVLLVDQAEDAEVWPASYDCVDAAVDKHAAEIMLLPSIVQQTRRSTHQVVSIQALNPREQDIARLISRGYSNNEIAAALHMSVATIKTYTSRMYRKLGVSNRVQLAMNSQITRLTAG